MSYHHPITRFEFQDSPRDCPGCGDGHEEPARERDATSSAYILLRPSDPRLAREGEGRVTTYVISKC